MDLHLLRRQPGHFGSVHSVHGLKLCAGPDLAGVGAQIHRTVERFHHQVREKWNFVYCLDFLGRAAQCGFGVAIVADALAGRLGLLAILLHHLSGAEAAHGAFIPFHPQRVARRLRLPEGICDHGHAGGHGGDLADSRQAASAGVIKSLHGGAEDGRARHHRGQHAGRLDVNSENGFAVGFFGGVQPLQRLADDFEILGIFKRRFGGRRHLRRRLRQLPVGKAAIAGIEYCARFGAATGRIHLPLLGRGRDQHGAGRRTRLAKLLERRPHAGAAAGHLHAKHRVVVFGIHRRRFEAHFAPVSVQLFSQQHRQSGVDALAHLGVIHDDRDALIAADAHEGIGHEAIGRFLISAHQLAGRRKINPDQQAAARRHCELQKITPLHDRGVHRPPAFAGEPAAIAAAR